MLTVEQLDAHIARRFRRHANPPEAQFVSDSQDVEAVKEHLALEPGEAEDFDSFFVVVGNGDYDAVYGMAGIIPYLNKPLEQLV